MADDLSIQIDNAIKELADIEKTQQTMIDNIRIQIYNYVKNADMAIENISKYVNLTHNCYIEVMDESINISHSLFSDAEAMVGLVYELFEPYFVMEEPKYFDGNTYIAFKKK
jgi:TATA-box binding protein (TBP) (component of TFIID and TFIIIB)